MSQFVEVKTADLTGPALDWAVAISQGGVASERFVWELPDGVRFYGRYSPSTDWSVGGPLWDEWATSMEHYDGWCVAVIGGDAQGPTKLISLCRAIVAAKLGDVVQVPTALIGGAA